MLIVFITHPEAKKVVRGHVRALSDHGKMAARAIGEELLALLPSILDEYGIEEINSIASSSSTRCVETAIIVSEILSDIANVDEILVDDAFKEKRIGSSKIPLSKEAVSQALRNIGPGAAVVALHGDLSLIFNAGLLLPSELDDEGWFRSRPIVAIVDFDLNKSIESGKLIICKKYNGIDFENILS